MRSIRAFVRWLFDWRTGLVIVSTALVALLAVAVVVSARSTQDALDANRVQRQANLTQVRELNARITTLEGLAREDSRHIAELLAEVTALQEQVRQLGGKPVVVNVTTSTTTSTVPPRSTTTTAAPSPSQTTTTTTPCLIQLGRCVRSSHGP